MIAPFARRVEGCKTRIHFGTRLALIAYSVSQVLSKDGNGQSGSPSGIPGFIPVAGFDPEQNADGHDYQFDRAAGQSRWRMNETTRRPPVIAWP